MVRAKTMKRELNTAFCIALFRVAVCLFIIYMFDSKHPVSYVYSLIYTDIVIPPYYLVPKLTAAVQQH